MKYRILIVLISVLLAHCASYIAIVCFKVWRDGVVYIEPNRVLLLAETITFLVYGLFSVFCIFYMLWEFLKYKKETNR